MKQNNRRLQALEERAAQRQAQQDHAHGAKERILARLNAIGQRLRDSGVVIEVDEDDFKQRLAAVRASIQRGLKEMRSGKGY